MKIRIKFQKQGTVRFIGHLDVMRYFQKVMRRAEVDIRYSEGFSPHQIMSFASPLSVGLISHAEYVDIDVNSSGNSTGMVRRLNEVSAEGLEVLSYRELPETAKNAMSLVAAADYTFWFKEGFAPEDGSSVEDFFREIPDILQKRDNSVCEADEKGRENRGSASADLRGANRGAERVCSGDGRRLVSGSGK